MLAFYPHKGLSFWNSGSPICWGETPLAYSESQVVTWLVTALWFGVPLLSCRDILTLGPCFTFLKC